MIITTEGYNLDHFRKGGGAAYFTKHSVVYSSKTNIRRNAIWILLFTFFRKYDYVSN